MKTKTFRAPIELKENGEKGEFTAVFSRFNVIDHDGDVTVPGAFRDGQKVRISYWGHRWQDLPVGKGVIHQDDEKAWVDGQFFLDTIAGKETYQTVKNLEELQEWSYGFDVEKAEPGVFDGRDVMLLQALDVHEVSPVMLGAGIGTGTTSIKDKKQDDPEGEADSEEAGDEAGKSDGKPEGVGPGVYLTMAEIIELED